MNSSTVLSSQENWIINGLVEEEGREKISRRLKMIRKEPMKLGIDRARLFTESFKTTEGQAMVLRWAKALKHIAENIPTFIGDDDLLVGRGDGQNGRYGILYPEMDGSAMSQMQKVIPTQGKSPFIITEDTARVLNDEIITYWGGKTFCEAFGKALPEDTRQLIFGDNPKNVYSQRGVLMGTATLRASLNYTHDYKMVIERGIKEIKREAEKRLAAIEKPVERVEKGPFLEAVIITSDAIVAWAQRYAKMAREMAENEKRPERQKELLLIAETCEWVPENPARTLTEAMQCQWFVHIFSRIEQNCGAALGNGRMDQYLYPYYKNDLLAGRITQEKARELFESLWMNLAEAMIARVTPAGADITEGYAHFEGVTLGGRTRGGKDATNELSYLILDSKQGLPLNYPDLGVRIHSQTPDKFLKRVCEIIKEGQGYPKLLNDEEVIPLYLAKGVAYEDALDYAISGCVENRIPSRDTYMNGCGGLNMAAVLELTLNKGKMKVYGDEQIGLKTAKPTEFTTFEELMNVFREQYRYVLKHVVTQQMVVDKVKPTCLAAPFTSMIHELCMEQCKDINGYVEGGFREQYADAVGFGTVIDSLAAIKKLVYDDGTISMAELLEALDANFEGKEVIRQMCLNAPKYGNNDSFADSIGLQVEKIHFDYLKSISGLHGELFAMRIIPLTAHIALGKATAASANGRKAGMCLSEGTSASHGADMKGITGNLLSNVNSKNSSNINRQARLLNVKLSPSSVNGEEGTRKLMSLIRSWCDMKLYHMQFNIINKEIMLAAQEDPEKYRDLIVRVAGYSAYFTDLSKELQNEIIARTEHAV